MRIRWRNFELPSRVEAEHESLTEEYGRFLIDPFERGFGLGDRLPTAASSGDVANGDSPAPSFDES